MTMTARTLVQKYLMGAYPATRDELVARARHQDAAPAVIGLVRQLEEERFESPCDVERALGHEHRPRTGAACSDTPGPSR